MKYWEATSKATVRWYPADGFAPALFIVRWRPQHWTNGDRPAIEDVFDNPEEAAGRVRFLLEQIGLPIDEVAWFDDETGEEGPE